MKEKKKKTCLGETMDRKTMTVWPLRPASGGAPKRGTKILQELHAYAHRDVRLAASQSWSQDHQTTHVVQESLEPGLKLALTLRVTLPLGASIQP